MVNVVASNTTELSSEKSPLIKYMLKTRENHARLQKHDYSHVFRKKTRFELFRMSTIAMAIEFAYAAETSFVSPILLQIGIDHKHMTMAWGLSPLIGFFVSPLLGSFSDRCKMKWGRRRPVITLLSLGIFLGLILVPHGRELGAWLGDEGYVDKSLAANFSSRNTDTSEGTVAALQSSDDEGPNASNFKYAAILTILGVVLLDFDADTCQTPARTYLLDMCIPEDQPRALTLFTMFAGMGGTIGYSLGAINWETLPIGVFLGGNIPTVFGLVTIIFVVCYFITVTTFREIPLKMLEEDELLRPLSEKMVRNEMRKNNNEVYYIHESSLLDKQATKDIEQIETTPPSVTESYQNGFSPALATIKPIASKTHSIEAQLDADTPITFSQYLKSIFVMPYSMRILALTNLLCWMGHVTYCLYFTDFVGEAVFKGDPAAKPNSEQANLYEEGVRFGCWGLAIYAASCSVYCMCVTKLMKWFGVRTVYISSMLYYGAGMLILGLWPTKWGSLLFSTSAGILYGTVFTIPYILVANYHAQNCFNIRNGECVPLKQPRGLGTDISIISSVVFVAQLIVSLCIGPLVDYMNTTCAILYASTVLAILSAISAIFVLYPS